MPNSDASGYSTASKHAIVTITSEMARKDDENAIKDVKAAADLAKKDEEMMQIRTQMEEIAKFAYIAIKTSLH